MEAHPLPVLHANATHLHPGARGGLANWEGVGGRCLLELSDGVTVQADLGADGRLTVPAHRTLRGTAIGEKVWQLELHPRAFRVRRRLG